MSVMTDGALVIARAGLTPALRDCLSFDPAVLVFSGDEAPYALSVIVQRRPSIVAVDRYFMSSGCGSDFLSGLRSVRPLPDLRVLDDQDSDIPVLLRRPALATGCATIAAASKPLVADARRAPRYPVHSSCGAVLNGYAIALVNVSVCGAQVLSPVVVRPLQHVRVALADETAAIRLRAAVAWSMFERCPTSRETRYRAGVDFTDANRDLLDAYCMKYGVQD